MTMKENLCKIKDGVGCVCFLGLMLLWGCVSSQELETARLRAEQSERELRAIADGPKVEDPQSAWMCGKRPSDLIFNLPDGGSISMVGIPCGSFVMGTPEPEMLWHGDCVGHKVTLTESYWIGKFPLTMALSRKLLPYEQSESKRMFSCAYSGKMRYDEFDDDWVDDQLTWNDAQRIVSEMNRLFVGSLPSGYHFALPTEAQWEYACRAGTVTTYNNGKKATLKQNTMRLKNGNSISIDMFDSVCPNLDEVGWYGGNSRFEHHRVGEKKPNVWGLFDMHGLCSEWCHDFYSDDLEKTSVNMIDPHGPREGDAHVLRGGGYGFDPCFCTAYHRMRGGSYPRHKKLPQALWGKPRSGSVRLAIVKDGPEAIDLSDDKIYGKNAVTSHDWAMGKIREIDERNRKAFEPIRKKVDMLPLVKFALATYEVAQPVIDVYVDSKIGEAIGSNAAVAAGADSGLSFQRGSATASAGAVIRRRKHSSCNGTGICNVCKGKGYLGNDPSNRRLKCRSCGGSKRCCACHNGYID